MSRDHVGERDPVTEPIIGCAIEVHRTLGPGLLESVYETCLCDELAAAGLAFVRQCSLPVRYKNRTLNQFFQIDMVVADLLVLEIKAVQQIHPLHEAQIQTYVRLSGLQIGLLLNFNAVRMIDGICRLVYSGNG